MGTESLTTTCTGNLKYTVVETFTESYNPTTTKLPEFKPAEQISCFRELGEAIERSGRGVGFKGDEKTVADYREGGFRRYVRSARSERGPDRRTSRLFQNTGEAR